MKVKDTVILKEVADDLNDEKAFYDQRESGVGDYFWDSLLADIESLAIYAGIHNREHGLHRMLAKRFPYAIYYEIVDDIAYVVAVLPMRRNSAWIKRKKMQSAKCKRQNHTLHFAFFCPLSPNLLWMGNAR